MAWNKQQQEAIDRRGSNILVSAAAGSGKTAVLVERIKKLIIDDGVGIDRLLVVTFSNAAAAEMKDRLVSALTEELDKPGQNGVFLRNQLNHVNSANISTFHAFSMEVIRRYFYLTEVPLDFRVCDEAQKSILQSESMEELFEEQFRNGSAEFTDFLNRYATGRNENDVKTMIQEVHRFIQSLPDPFQWLDTQIDMLGADELAYRNSVQYRMIREEIALELDNALESLQKVDELLDRAGVESLAAKSARDVAAVDGLLELFRHKDFEEFAAAAKGVAFETFRVAKSEEPCYAGIKDQIKMLRDKAKDCIKKKISETYLKYSLSEWIAMAQATRPAAETLTRLVRRFDGIYKAKKLDKGIIDFNDIEHYALDILRHPDPASEYRDKFIHIFIDEYQDSNIVQETLIDLIKRDNNVFMVGDVKQSIYKFRLAEPELFLSKYRTFSEDRTGANSRIDLNMNYRSKTGVIGTINGTFRTVMQPGTAGIAYDSSAELHPGIEGCPESLSYHTDLYIIDDRQLEGDDADEEINEMKKAEVEAASVAAILRDCIGKPIYDAKRKIERPIEYRDIAVLFRSAKGYSDIFAEIFAAEGIPCYADTGEGYFDTIEISVFLNLLRIIGNKRQDIPLISVLRSPVFGFTTEELSAVRIHLKGTAYFQAFISYADTGDDQDLAKKCRLALDKLAGWKTEAAFMTLEELLWMLMRETGYYDYAGAIPGGERRQANLRALIDRAVAFQNAHMKGMFGFINYIEMLQKDKVATGQTAVITEGEDVVRIMTVHKSKGLEFPVVLVCGLGKRFNRDVNSSKVALHKSAGIGLRYVDPELGCHARTLAQTVIERQKIREGIAEEIRILYVAMTRAMDRLILVGTARNASDVLERCAIKDGSDIPDVNNFLEWILIAADRQSCRINICDRATIGRIRRDADETARSLLRRIDSGFEGEIDDAVCQAVAERLAWQYPKRRSLGMQSKFSVSELIRGKFDDQGCKRGRTGEEKEWKLDSEPLFVKGSPALTAAEKGTAVHKVMEHISFDQSNDAGRVAECIAALRQKFILGEQEANALDSRSISAFFDSDIGRRACSAKQLRKEAAFNYQKPIGDVLADPETAEDDRIIIQGTIDCFFEEDDGLVLLDYKTDRLCGDPVQWAKDMTDRYRPQIRLYREALEACTGGRVKEAWLFLFDIGEAVEVQL